ncbi:hypothetical protein [Qipengyuania sp.]|uniref:hypothetical protein n=1 Tax=Qipengyuania sp. TaxID=2004515 RepID=UPI003735164A
MLSIGVVALIAMIAALIALYLAEMRADGVSDWQMVKMALLWAIIIGGAYLVTAYFTGSPA